MKRLLLTCTDLMAIQFLVPHVKYLSEHGFSVELACSEVGGRLQELRTVAFGHCSCPYCALGSESVFAPQSKRLKRPEEDH